MRPTHHRCPRCGVLKPATGEHFSLSRRDGHVTSYCRPCAAAYGRAYRAAGRHRRRPPRHGPVHRCARCGELKPTTARHWYFDRDGHITGYCRPCQNAYTAAYDRAGRRPAHYQRDWLRRKRGTPPERYRQREPAMLAGEVDGT
jgi:hypothetical protein